MKIINANFIKPVLGSALLCIAAVGANTYAQSATPVHSPDQIKAQYKADLERCDALSGNDKDVCQKQAEANRDSAKANAKSGKKSAEARHDALTEKRDAQYDVAKEKCDTLSGDAQDKCEADAKSKYGK